MPAVAPGFWAVAAAAAVASATTTVVECGGVDGKFDACAPAVWLAAQPDELLPSTVLPAGPLEQRLIAVMRNVTAWYSDGGVEGKVRATDRSVGKARARLG